MIGDTPDEIDYSDLLAEADGLSFDETVAYIEKHLPYICRDAYLASTIRATEIVRIEQGGFDYIFDDYASLEVRGVVPYSMWEESRLVAAVGRSRPRRRARDDYRLRGWVGSTADPSSHTPG